MDDLNTINQHYYREHGTYNVPDILATARPIQEALRLLIESSILRDPISVLELGFGSRPDRYLHIESATNRLWEVVLSDFSADVLPPLSVFSQDKVKVSLSPLDLLQGTFLKNNFDVIVSTYVFDSITFPEDAYEDGFHYPGGLLKTIDTCLSHLNPGGIFLTIDAWAKTKSEEYQPAHGARFKSLDMTKAYTRLVEKYGNYRVSLVSLNDFLEHYNQSLPLDLSDLGCMMVS